MILNVMILFYCREISALDEVETKRHNRGDIVAFVIARIREKVWSQMAFRSKRDEKGKREKIVDERFTFKAKRQSAAINLLVLKS